MMRFLVVVVFLLIPVFCGEHHANCECGEVTPPDSYIFFYETITVNCTLQNVTQTQNSSTMYFVRYSPDGEKIPSEIIDNKTIVLKKMAEPGDEGIYYCKRETSSVHDIIGSHNLTLEYKPPKLTEDDFNCTNYNFGERMDCRWELPFLSLEYIDVTLTWKYKGKQEKACPSMNEEKTMCTWDAYKDAIPLLLSQEMMLSLEIHNTKTDTLTVNKFGRIMRQYVKPKKVIKFSVSPTNDSHCLSLEWQYDTSYSYREQLARIRYVSKRNNETLTSKSKRYGDNMVKCSFFPNTDYNFTIITRAKTGFWSDAVVKVFTTEEDVPTGAPEMWPGFYEYIPCSFERKQRSVTMFWKELPENTRNGVITGYSIAVHNIDKKSIKNVGVVSTLSKVLLLNCTDEYSVTVRARTRKGKSNYTSSLIISSAFNKDSVTMWVPPKMIIEKETSDKQGFVDVYNVSWTLNPGVDVSQIKGFSVLYCVASNMMCQGELQGVKVTNEHRWFELRDMQPGEYLIGVSMESSTKSSGVSFTSCVYMKDAVPPIPGSVKVTTRNENCLTVRWGPTECNRKHPYVVRYTVFWCKIKNKKCYAARKSHVILSSNPLLYEIKNLDKDQVYGIEVQAHSRYKDSQLSEMIVGKPSNNDLSEGEIAAITIASVLVLTLFLTGCLFFIRVLKTKIKNMNMDLEFEIPAVENNGSILGEDESCNPILSNSSFTYLTSLTSKRNSSSGFTE